MRSDSVTNNFNIKTVAYPVPNYLPWFAAESASGIVLLQKTDGVVPPQQLDQGTRIKTRVIASLSHLIEMEIIGGPAYPQDPPPRRHKCSGLLKVSIANN